MVKMRRLSTVSACKRRRNGHIILLERFPTLFDKHIAMDVHKENECRKALKGLFNIREITFALISKVHRSDDCF